MTLRADSLEKLPKTLLAKFLKGGEIGIFIKNTKTTNFSTVFFHYLKLKLNNVQILKKKKCTEKFLLERKDFGSFIYCF